MRLLVNPPNLLCAWGEAVALDEYEAKLTELFNGSASEMKATHKDWILGGKKDNHAWAVMHRLALNHALEGADHRVEIEVVFE